MGSVVLLPSPPVSMASIRASVSLLRIQSISCRCDLSPELSRRRRPGIRPADPAVDFGNAFRPSNRSTSRRSTSRMVSSTQRSSPPSADSIESGRAERSKSWRRERRWYEPDNKKNRWFSVFVEWTYMCDQRWPPAQSGQKADYGRHLVAQFGVRSRGGGTGGWSTRLTRGGRTRYCATSGRHARQQLLCQAMFG